MASEPVPEWTSISDPALAQRLQKIIDAYRRVGLQNEARMLAVEALTRS